MNARERVLAVLNRQPVDRTPVDLWCTPEINTALKTYTGVKSDLDLYKALGLDKIVWVFPGYTGTIEGEEAGGSTHYGGVRSMWGTPLKDINTGNALYQEFGEPPLKDYETVESLDAYPYWPDPDLVDYEGATALARELSKEYAIIGPWVSFFEIYCQMRGLENAMIDILMMPDYVNTALDRIESIQTEIMRRFFDKTRDCLDLVFISDDMGGQDNLLISLDMWDMYFRERMIRWCDLVHSYGLKVFFHTDGAAYDLVPRLIDVGSDVFNPIQHTAAGMDMAKLKHHFGDRLIFHGGVDTQSALPFGTIEDVREETRNCLRTLGAGGGYICCSCHNVQPGTPVENVVAMIETVKAEG